MARGSMVVVVVVMMMCSFVVICSGQQPTPGAQCMLTCGESTMSCVQVCVARMDVSCFQDCYKSEVECAKSCMQPPPLGKWDSLHRRLT